MTVDIPDHFYDNKVRRGSKCVQWSIKPLTRSVSDQRGQTLTL